MRAVGDPRLTPTPVPPEDCAGLKMTAWASLPLNVRLQHRLGELLSQIDGVRREFHTEEANGLLWIEPLMDRAFDEINSAIQRVSD
jgi:hypothetical protein